MASSKKPRKSRPSALACKRRGRALAKKRTASAGKSLAACRRPAKRTSVRNGWQDSYMKDFDGLIYVRRERLDRGGYTSSGKYFGIGAPLFHYEGEWEATKAWNDRSRPESVRDHYSGERLFGQDYQIDDYIRAADRLGAIDKLRKMFPRAKFSGVKNPK
jgi:hypothetical protein